MNETWNAFRNQSFAVFLSQDKDYWYHDMDKLRIMIYETM